MCICFVETKLHVGSLGFIRTLLLKQKLKLNVVIRLNRTQCKALININWG